MADDEATIAPIWVIHGGSDGEADKLFLEEGYVSIGWELLFDLSTIPASVSLLRERLAESYPSTPVTVLTRHAGEIFEFAHEMTVGDRVVYPSKRDHAIHLGRIVGPYEYRPDFSPFPYARKVEWLRMVPRSDYTVGALKEFGRRMTVTRVKEHHDEVEASFGGGPDFPIHKRPRRYWAYLAKPSRYRIEEAAQEVSRLDAWPTEGRDVRKGDRALFWKALGGKGTRRGVVALGEVATDPAMRDDADNPFWTDKADGEGVELRVQVRYVNPPDLPLWYGDAVTPVLAQLSVGRAQGGTLFNVTPEQWEAVVSAAGGWPDDAPEVQDIRDAVAVQAGRKPSGQGFRMDPQQRRAIEQHAMEMAKAYFKEHGWTTIDDVSLRKSYDLHCSRADGSELRVEVKGTTGTGATVLLTPNEVTHAHKHHPNVALFIVANVALSSVEGKPLVSGGDVIVHEPWKLEDEGLTAIGYEYAVPKKSQTHG